jgi:hypothetical protein
MLPSVRLIRRGWSAGRYTHTDTHTRHTHTHTYTHTHTHTHIHTQHNRYSPTLWLPSARCWRRGCSAGRCTHTHRQCNNSVTTVYQQCNNSVTAVYLLLGAGEEVVLQVGVPL